MDQVEERNVAVFLYEGVELLDFGGPGEVFAVTDGFNVYTVAAGADPITSQGFVGVAPEFATADAPQPDILVLPGGLVGAPLADDGVIDWIRAAGERAEISLSVCTGAFLLAKAGLLDGLQATTWHGAIERLREFAPKTTVLEHTRFVDNGKIVTTAGVSAGIDGALHVVSRLMGEQTARETARYMEYDRWVPEQGTVVETAGD
jgi:transcriptional regulator GlxA family with amidase domain